ncbi:Zinc finger protein [Plecturocebus cupreus]
MCYHVQLIFVFLVDTGFHHVDQAGLELLTSSDPTASPSKSAEITGTMQGRGVNVNTSKKNKRKHRNQEREKREEKNTTTTSSSSNKPQ